MKRNFSETELNENFSLSFEEISLISKSDKVFMLGFMILLKYFLYENKFPESKKEIPKSVILYIAKELNIDFRLFDDYKLEGRTYYHHKNKIRKFLGFEEATQIDFNNLSLWLFENMNYQNFDEDILKEMLYKRFKELKLIPLNTNQVNRLVNKVMFKYEENIFENIYSNLSDFSKASIDSLLLIQNFDDETISFGDIRNEVLNIKIKSILKEIKKLEAIRKLQINDIYLKTLPLKILKKYKVRIQSEDLREIRRHPEIKKYAMLSILFYLREMEITDNIVYFMTYIIHKINVRAERKIEKELFEKLKRVNKKMNILFKFADLSLNNPDGVIKDILYPEINTETLQNLIKEFNFDISYNYKVKTTVRYSYGNSYRRVISKIFNILDFRASNNFSKPILNALKICKSNYYLKSGKFLINNEIPIEKVIKKSFIDFVIETDNLGNKYIDKINYEIAVLDALRDKILCREIWIKNSYKYRNPDEDIPVDFEINKVKYYEDLNLPLDKVAFIEKLRLNLDMSLKNLDNQIVKNKNVEIITKNKKPWIKVSPVSMQEEPTNLTKLKSQIIDRYETINLLDILKETDLRLHFTKSFKTLALHERMDSSILQKRLLLNIYALGTNTGIKNVSAANDSDSENYKNLLYVRKKFITKENLKVAIQTVVNAILEQRSKEIWGETTTSCASDSKKFDTYNQNILTEYHNRYHGYGVMIYWHVEKKSICIHSQLKRCSSSEVASMIDGLLRHSTEMNVEKNYVDTHGQSEIAFAFCHLLGFKLMPRIKSIYSQKLHRAYDKSMDNFKNIDTILSKPINWNLIEEQYDQMIKYATALKLGSADTESLLKRFTRNNFQHPTYKALSELGKAVKTIFLTEYLSSENIRQEINEGLNVVENWNSANNFIFYGRSGTFSDSNIDNQEIAMLCMHLLQNCIIYINTIIIEKLLPETGLLKTFTEEDFRALTPLFYLHINPYGIFELDMKKRLFNDF